MQAQRPRFIKPGDEALYPSRNRDGVIETLINPNVDTALLSDNDSKTSFVYNRYHHLPLDTQRQRLPVFQYRNHILYLLEKYQTLVLIGETGCGKSTQVPQYLFEIGHRVCVTQPRVTACVSLAYRVAEERGEQVGEQVGYAAGMTSQRSAESGIVFMTEGVLLREMFASPLLMQYSCIVLDEVHERSQMTDVLMGLLKKIIKKRKNLKLVISSATMDAEFLRDFFNLKDKRDRDKPNTSIIMSMQGRMHPIDVFYSEEPVPDYVKATVDTVIKIHENEPFGDILAFLTSQEEILSAQETLQTYADQNNASTGHRTHQPSGIRSYNMLVLAMYGSLPHYKQVRVFQRTDANVRKVLLATNIAETSVTVPGVVYVLKLIKTASTAHRIHHPSGIRSYNMLVLAMYGSLPHYKQVRVFQRTDANVRKVLLATNIAETSVTVPGVVYVIDSGFHKLPYFSPTVGVESLTITPISKNNATQRAGRAGRTSRGKCYRLYTEEEYDKLPPSVPPEMCRSDLSAMLLQLKALGIHNLLRFTFPTPPPAKSILAGLETLYALKTIDKSGQLTPLGERVAELPLRPMCAAMLCNSGVYGCIDEALSITAMLQVDSVFIKPNSGREGIAAKVSRRNHFEVAEGDIIMYLNIFEGYLKLRSSQDEKKSKKVCREWCQKYYINYKVMEKACEIRQSLEKIIRNKFQMENQTIEGLELGSGKLSRIMKCVTSGFFSQAAYLSTDSSYRGVRGAVLHVSPDSCLFTLQQPKWVIFGSVQSTGDKTYMRDMMTIDKQTLLEIAPHYYTET